MPMLCCVTKSSFKELVPKRTELIEEVARKVGTLHEMNRTNQNA